MTEGRRTLPVVHRHLVHVLFKKGRRYCWREERGSLNNLKWTEARQLSHAVTLTDRWETPMQVFAWCKTVYILCLPG
jgi:hypothetical protein